MTDSLLRSVVHPTVFSPAGLDAFAHALRLAVAAKSHFYILHIERETEQADWVQFPRVRETLAAWGMIAPDAPRSAVASELGLRGHGKGLTLPRSIERGNLSHNEA